MQHLRIIAIAAIAIISASTSNAQTKQSLKITDATVFLKGAELTSTAKVSFTKGENTFLFTNVAGNVNTSSLTINASGGVVVQSATFQNNYLNAEVLSPRGVAIKDSLEILDNLVADLNNKLTVIAEQTTILQTNRKVGGDNTGLSVAELTKMLDLTATRMESLLSQKNKHIDLQKNTNERIAKLKLQLQEEKQKGYQPGGQLLVKFHAEKTTTSDVVISYVVSSAQWTPLYDVFADDAVGPIVLHYKANVYQNSGVSWDNIHLSLSTGNPSEGVNIPVLSPWYLSFSVPTVFRGVGKADAYVMQRGNGVNIGGARKSGTLYIIDGVQVQNIGDEEKENNSTMDNYVAVDNSGVNTTFDIDLPYTIPSDGKEHLVAVKKHEVPASYRYYAIPKLDNDAFLQAEITNWETLNLLPGQTNIFYEGSYVGQGYLDMLGVKDTMTISLGRDKKIVIKREQDRNKRSVKMIGSNKREAVAYTITVRNGRKEKINLILQDQIPVSNDKDIVIEDVEKSASEYDPEKGLLKWTLSPEPNETKSFTFEYTIKYPKNKKLN